MITVTGKTVDEAIARGLAELSLSRENAQIKIMEEGSKGLFGIGAREAIVQVGKKQEFSNEEIVEEIAEEILHTDDIYEKAQEFLTELATKMGIDDISFKRLRNRQGYTIKIDTKDAGLLIGKRGQTLNAIQYLVNIHINRGNEEKVFYVLDIENYRDSREKSLQELSRKLANKVRERGKNIELEPMTSRERRIIHMTLKNHPHVTTFSKGDDPYRKVIISLKNRRAHRRSGYEHQ